MTYYFNKKARGFRDRVKTLSAYATLNNAITHCFLLIVMVVMTHQEWFSFNSILTHGDWPHWYTENMAELFSLSGWATWNSWPNMDFGSQNIQVYFFPVMFIWGLFGHLGLDYHFATRVTIFIPIAVFAPLTSYLLVKRFTKSYLAAFIGALIYTFNSYFIATQTQHPVIALVYSIAPLIFLEFDKLLKEPTSKRVIVFTLVYSIGFLYEARIMYIMFWIMALFFLYRSVFKVAISLSNKLILRISTAGILLLLLNIFWLLPSLTAYETISATANRGLFGNEFLNTLRAFALFHPFWTGKEPAWFIVQAIPLGFWLLPLLAFSSLLIKRSNIPKEIYFFAGLALLGVLLTKQSAPPLPDLYRWLYENFPGFNLFRYADKFYLIIALSYSVLIGYTTNAFFERLKEQHRNAAAHILLIVVCFLALWNAKPLLTKEIGTLFVPQTIPEDYLVLKDYVYEQGEYFRTLWVPGGHRFGFFNFNHPALSTVTQIQSSWRQYMPTEKSKRYTSVEEQIVSILEQPYSNFLLDSASVKYIILPSDPLDEIYRYYGSRDYFKSSLEKVPYFERVDIGTKEVLIYNNDGYKPRIYIPSSALYISDVEELVDLADRLALADSAVFFESDAGNKKYNIEEINRTLIGSKSPEAMLTEWRMINPTKYRVVVRGVSNPFLLVFSENFSRGWKAYIVGHTSRRERDETYLPDVRVIIQNNGLPSGSLWETWLKEPLPDHEHFLVNGYANAWYIRPEDAGERKDYEVIIEYWPQKLFYIGLAVSGATLLACLAYLGYDFLRSRQGKRT